MDYDVLILGGGIIGCAVAYELSKYNINIALIEKDYDVANDISFTNTTIIYDGSETNNNTMAILENKGMHLIQDHCKKFDIKYCRIGSLKILSNNAECDKIDEMYRKSRANGIEGISIVNSDEIQDIEPNLKMDISKALYSKNTAIISPYNLVLSYAEVAADNGVNFRLEEEVIDINAITKGFKVTTNKNKFTCKFVVNTIPNEFLNDKCYKNYNYIKNGKIKYILLNDQTEDNVSTIISNNVDKYTCILNVPTTSKESLIGIRSDRPLSLKKELELIESVFQDVNKQLISNIFTEEYDENSMFIDDSDADDGYIKVVGNHYAKVTVAPAIASQIEEKIKVNMNITKKRDYVDRRREMYVFRNMSKEQRNKVIALDNRYGNIICNCNNVSEGEIIDSIRRPLGARTLEGVKRRTGIGLGGCNGSHCNMKIIKVLAREMNKSALTIVDDSVDSKIFVGRIKEFYEI
jgi:L-2-hydroxyglutarate oxidase LhgO